MAEIDQDIRLETGGISFSPFIKPDLHDPQRFVEGIQLSSHCLDFKIPAMYKLIQELLSATDFDNLERLRTLIVGVSGLPCTTDDLERLLACQFHCRLGPQLGTHPCLLPPVLADGGFRGAQWAQSDSLHEQASHHTGSYQHRRQPEGMPCPGSR